MKSFLEKLSAERCENLEFHNKMDVSHVFDDRDALDAKNLFVSRFNRIPNWINLEDISFLILYS